MSTPKAYSSAKIEGEPRFVSLRNPENAERICTLIAEGYTLRQIAREIGCESHGSAITAWARDNEEFATRYARAMDLRADRMADELLEIADDGTNDWIERQVGEDETITIPDHEHIQRSRLRVDTRKWLMAKMMPKKYGERTTLAGDPDNPVHVATTIEDKRAAAKALLDGVFGKKAE